MKKWIKRIGLFFIALSYVFLILVWHPWQTKRELNLISVPVAKERIKSRNVIEEDDLEWVEVPSRLISDQIATVASQIVGKVVSSDILIPAGSFFDKACLEEETKIKDRSSLALKLNQAAYAVSVDLYQAGGNTLVINQKVDLYVSINQRSEKPVTDCLLKNVRILDLRDRKGLSLEDEEGTGVASTVILAVKQEMIPLLTAASLLGTISLYATDESWNTNHECQLNEQSQVLEYLQ